MNTLPPQPVAAPEAPSSPPQYNSALTALQRSLASGELLLEPADREKYAGDTWFAARVPDAT